MLAAIAMLVAGCTALGPTASTGPTSATSPPSGQVAKTGIVQMWVTDAPRTDNISEIWVTVSDVKIHEAAVGQVSDNGSDEAEGEIDDSADTGGGDPVTKTRHTTPV